MVVAMVEASLPAEELQPALQHLTECLACEQLIGEVLRSWERAGPDWSRPSTRGRNFYSSSARRQPVEPSGGSR
jgi:hypothetical protein